MNFKILFPTGEVINSQTKLTKNGIPFSINTEKEALRFIKKQWCIWCGVKSFSQWAEELNEEFGYNSENRLSAISHMASNFTLNINNKHVNIYELWMSIYTEQAA